MIAMSIPLTLEIRRPELASSLREKMGEADFDVEEVLDRALWMQDLAAGLSSEPVLAATPKLTALASATDLYVEQARIIDLAVAFQKADKFTQGAILWAMSMTKYMVRPNKYEYAASLAQHNFGIAIRPDVLEEYWKLIRAPHNDEEINAFFNRASETPPLREKLIAAAKNYTELARVVSANGLKKSPAQLEQYLASWKFLSLMMRAMVERGAMTPEEFKERAGFAYKEWGIAGLGKDMDVEIMGGVLSATGWAGKILGISSAKVPMAAIIFPATAVIMGGMNGEKFNFNQLGNMFAQSFQMALEGMVLALEDLSHTFSKFFG